MIVNGLGAVVTGGASGLGRAVVARLCQEGAFVTVLDRDVEAGESVAAEEGSSCAFERSDIADPDSVAEAIESANRRAPLRILVNCAGIGAGARVLGRDGAPHDRRLWNRVIAVNLTGTFVAMAEAARYMAKNEPLAPDNVRGVVINTSSAAAYDGQRGQAAYAASKGAIVSLTLPAARDLAAVGVRVCAVAPGAFETPMLSRLDDTLRAQLEAEIPFPSRLGRPTEFAALVLSMIENDYLNGEVIRFDAGMRMR